MRSSKKNLIKVCVRIFDGKQREFIEACLTLFKHQESFCIEITSARDADVVFICPTEPGAEKQIDALMNKMNKIVVVYSNNNTSLSPWSIERPAKKESLGLLLNKLLPLVKSKKTPTIDSSAITESKDRISPFPKEALNHFRYLETSKNFLKIEINSKCFYYDTKKKIFLSCCDDDSKQIILEKTNKIQAVHELPSDAKELASISESKWNAIYYNMQDKTSNLSFNCEKKYSLTKWPNFKNLFHDKNDILLSSFFLRFSSSVLDAACKLNLEPAYVENFCSRALLSGYITNDTRSFQTPTPAAYPTSKKIIHSIFKVLRREAQ